MLVFYYFKIPFKFVLKKTIIGFVIDRALAKKYKELIYLLPLIWAIPLIYHGWYIATIPIIIGLKDIYDYIRLTIKVV